ncbi:hypothetical protein ACFZDK_39575 [Streptomyces sp. NPDC007901]|uniref:hypothetical protein n=1 Tax=Streptomyces sp. NPDC007901 TaxID=3364785 RepID=UPI0036E8A2BE
MDTKAFSDWTAIHGHVPASAVSVRITWADRGTAGPVEVDGKRYLVTYARYGDRDPLAWSAYTVQAPDARGRVVAEERPDN